MNKREFDFKAACLNDFFGNPEEWRGADPHEVAEKLSSGYGKLAAATHDELSNDEEKKWAGELINTLSKITASIHMAFLRNMPNV